MIVVEQQIGWGKEIILFFFFFARKEIILLLGQISKRINWGNDKIYSDIL